MIDHDTRLYDCIHIMNTSLPNYRNIDVALGCNFPSVLQFPQPLTTCKSRPRLTVPEIMAMCQISNSVHIGKELDRQMLYMPFSVLPARCCGEVLCNIKPTISDHGHEWSNKGGNDSS